MVQQLAARTPERTPNLELKKSCGMRTFEGVVPGQLELLDLELSVRDLGKSFAWNHKRHVRFAFVLHVSTQTICTNHVRMPNYSK